MKTNTKHYSFASMIVCILMGMTLFSFSATSNAAPLSIEDEKATGEKFIARVRSQFELVEDDFANDFINDLGQHIAKFVETKHFPFHFYIINHHTLNAFAGPGGHIFFYTGLIDAMDTVDELAAVISHEIGHVSARHLAHRIDQNKKIGIASMAGMLAGVLIGGKAAGAIMTGSMAAAAQKQLAYSRNDERQADQLGFKYMDASGFNPSGMVSMLKILLKDRPMGADAIPTYLLTHPGGPERMSNTEVMLSGYEKTTDDEKTKKFRNLFPFLKTILKAKYAESQDAEREFYDELEKRPDSMSAHYGLGLFQMERSEYEQAVLHFERALKRDPSALLVLRSLGETYQFMGEDKKAIKVLEKSLRIDHQNRNTQFLLAVSYQNLNEYAKAIRVYERLTLIKPTKDQVFYNLGVCYGRLDRLGLAHYNFGIFFRKARKLDKARFHFEKAYGLAGNDPGLKRRITKAWDELK